MDFWGLTVDPASIGAAGLLVLAVLMVLTGRLVPRYVVRGIERERDLWRDVALRAMGHTEQLLPGAQIAAEVTRALGDAAVNRRVVLGEGGDR